MKAKVIATGEIVDVSYYQTNGAVGFLVKETSLGSSARIYRNDQIELISDPTTRKEIDWEQRRFELVKAALVGLLANEEVYRTIYEICEDECKAVFVDLITKYAIKHADAVFDKLKEE